MATASPSTTNPLRPAVLVLPAFGADDFQADTTESDELVRWLDTYDLDGLLEIPGANAPVYATAAAQTAASDTTADQPGGTTADQPAGLAVTTTGMGKAEAATTVSALCAAPAIDLTSTTIVTVGIAGGPAAVPVGSVVVADAVVDWDLKHRFDPGTRDLPIDVLAYRPHDYAWPLNVDLVTTAVDAIDTTELTDDEAISAHRTEQAYDDVAPNVQTGVTISGDEFWHGTDLASQAAWLCEQYDLPAYRRTEMEDAATAAALQRYDLRDQYLTVRAIACSPTHLYMNR